MKAPRERIREEIRQKYDAKEAFDAIEEFLVKPSQSTLTKALGFEKRITDKMAEPAEGNANLGAVAVNLYKLKNQYLLIYKVMETKCVQLAGSMIYALNREDYLLLALCARSLIEHAAFLSYLVREARLEDIEALFSLYVKSLYSKRYFDHEGLVDTINLLDMMEEHLPGDADDVKLWYDSLADFVHPAFSSNVLIFDEFPGEDTPGPSVQHKKAAIEKVLHTAGVAVRYLNHTLEGFASVGMTVDSTLQKTLKSGTRPESLTDKKPVPDKRPEHPGKWQPAGEEPKIERGPLGGAVFFDKNGRIWQKY